MSTKPKVAKQPERKREGFCGLGRNLAQGSDIVTRLRAMGLPVCCEAARLIEEMLGATRLLTAPPKHKWHVGIDVQEALDSRGWTQGDLAWILGVGRSAVNQLVTGKVKITARKAHMLGAAFNDTPAEVWLRRQMLCDYYNAKAERPS